MIVSVTGQEPGAAAAVPRSSGQPPPIRGGTPPHAPSGVAASAKPKAPAVAGDPAPAFFDANGDGVIENWSFLHGGDSFTTFTPAPPGSDPPPAHPASSSAPSAAVRHAGPNAHDPDHLETPVAIHHAHDAYQRDGMSGAATEPAAVHASTPPTPAVPTASLPRTAGSPALPSTR